MMQLPGLLPLLTYARRIRVAPRQGRRLRFSRCYRCIIAVLAAAAAAAAAVTVVVVIS